MAGITPIVSIGHGEHRAELAFAFPYEPSIGDELLVIGKANKYYAIGVLSAHGEMALRFMGDVRLQAVGGKLELEGDRGVRVRGESVELVAKTLKSMADSIVERANDAYRRIRGTLDVHAGEKRELIEGTCATRAETVNTVTSGTVTINGKQIHLG